VWIKKSRKYMLYKCLIIVINELKNFILILNKFKS